MQILILNHYPPVIKQIREMQQIAKAEDIEFSKLNASINEVIRNMFVFTADETGVRRFEKLLGIKPKAGWTLDSRKMYIVAMENQRKMSISELEGLIRNYVDVELHINVDMENLEATVGGGVSNTGLIYRIMDAFMPLNISIRFAVEFEELAVMFPDRGKVLEMETSAPIRGNAADEWQQRMSLEAETDTRISHGGLGKTELEAEKDLWYLDGSEVLDGGRLLDAAQYKEDL